MNWSTTTLPRKLDRVKLPPVSPLEPTIGSVKSPATVVASVAVANVTVDVTVEMVVSETVVVTDAADQGRLGCNAAPT